MSFLLGQAVPSQSLRPKSGKSYRAANGTPIKAYGERSLKGVTDNWHPFNIEAQVAAVKSPLGSVMHMIKSGIRLVFDNNGSYMQNKSTGQILEIHERDGGFEMDLWVEGSQLKPPKKRISSGQYDVFIESEDEDKDEEHVNMDFIRQA